MTDTFAQIRRRGVTADALHVAQEAAALPVPILREMAPLLAQAELETARGLRSWLASGKGDARFTAYEYARVLTQLRAAMDTIGRMKPALTVALSSGSQRAGVLSASHLTGIINRNSARFSTHLEAPIRLDLARIMATGQGLIPRFQASAARYANGVHDEIRRELAVGVLKNESFSGLIERLAKRGNVTRAAGDPPPVAGAASGLLRGASSNIERLVRTEMHFAYEQQAFTAYEQAKQSIPGLRRQFCAALDMRVCVRCAELHDTISGPDGHFASGDPPIHPRCRCVSLPYMYAWSAILDEAA